MTPGTCLYDDNFTFKDGETKGKIFIVLNHGDNGSYLAVKTTSQGDRYGIQYGCQVMERFPNFHLVKGCCCFSSNTWVQLDDFYEFEKAKLVQKVMTSEIKRIGVLEQAQAIELLKCATNSEDINLIQEKAITDSLDLLNKLEESPTQS